MAHSARKNQLGCIKVAIGFGLLFWDVPPVRSPMFTRPGAAYLYSKRQLWDFVKSYQGYQGLVKSDGTFHVAMHLLFYVFCISVYFLSSGTSFDIATDFVCSNFSVVSGFRDGFKNLDPPPVDLWPQVVRPPMRPFHHPTEFPQPFRFTMSYLPRMDGRIPAWIKAQTF